MNELKVSPDAQRLSASELRKLPLDEREAILRAQATLAEEHYRRDPHLTDFEAFDEVDLHDDLPFPEERPLKKSVTRPNSAHSGKFVRRIG